MKRRDLLAAVGFGPWWALGAPGLRRRAAPPWAFRLDPDLRWSLVSRRGLPVVRNATVTVALVGLRAATLGDLERVRRVRLADDHGDPAGWQIAGTAAGVEVVAQFLDGPVPRISVTARGLAQERRLDEIRFLDTGAAQVAHLGSDAGVRDWPADPVLWLNGYRSRDACRLVPLDEAGDAEGHWQLAVLPRGATQRRARGAPGLALSFGIEDAGQGVFTVSGPRLAAASRFAGRPLSVALAPAAASLAIVPADDPMAALADLAATDRALAPGEVPTGWCSWYELHDGVTEADLLDNLTAARQRIGPASFGVIQLDDGYQRAAGDWETNAKFPHGHRWLTERIHDAGFQAGLWLAPFAVGAGSGIPVAHPEWLLQTPHGEPIVLDERPAWGGRVYGLDPAQRPVRDYLRDLARHVVSEWGYDLLKLDHLDYGAAGAPSERRLSPAEACRAGLRALREGAGRAFVLGCDAPLQHAAGLVDGMRIAPDVDTSFARLQPAAGNVALRSHLHGSAWLNDPGCIVVREPLTTEEARTWATVVALSGGMSLAGDRLDRLPADRFEILQRVLPVADVRFRGLGATPTPSPPGFGPEWFLAEVRDDWWMLAAVNWTDVPRLMAVALADHGIRGPLAAYDVWSERRQADVDGRVTLSVAAHAATVLSLRRRRRVPYVLGSTRHVVQGAVDLAEERWDARRRALRARSVGLDGRRYSVTVALPPGFVPREGRTEPDAEVAVALGDRAATLSVAATGEEVAWEIRF
jgi:alpha-galactosidase